MSDINSIFSKLKESEKNLYDLRKKNEVTNIELFSKVNDEILLTKNEFLEEKITQLNEKYLQPPRSLNPEWLDKLQISPEFSFNELLISFTSLPSDISNSDMRLVRPGLKNDVIDLEEYVIEKEDLEANASNSLSLTRGINTTSKTDFIKGKAGFMPFQPGGLNSATILQSDTFLNKANDDGLFDIPPNFTRGILFSEKSTVEAENDQDVFESLNEPLTSNDQDNDYDIDMLQTDFSSVLDFSNLKNNNKVDSDTNVDNMTKTNLNKEIDSQLVDDLLAQEVEENTKVVSTNVFNLKKGKSSWAHVIDVNEEFKNFNQLVPDPAITYPFELDSFQKHAIYHLEQGDSVFVAAHTSAGKTVVAEYAIAMSNRNMTKTIYTSPIKALSNQKFRDFKEKFDDVGLFTGDVQLNPDANCLIMTTEILRSMLYRGADVIRDLEFIVFDEVHYVNDMERGVVWEEVIIMLPEHVKMILLSATVPNTVEFANWVGRTKQKDIYVISTTKRPVPLEMYLYANKEMFKIVDANREFLQKNYKACEYKMDSSKDPDNPKNAPKSAENESKREVSTRGRGGVSATRGGSSRGGGNMTRGGSSRGGARGGNEGARGRGNSSAVTRGRGGSLSNTRFSRRAEVSKPMLLSIIQKLYKDNLLPGVVFVFSRKKCEIYAGWMISVNYTTQAEKSDIHIFIEKALGRLKKEDRALPQIIRMKALLMNGIAVHHSGLLPIMKEVVEILFARNLIKVLFATETFAMGLNLPTRTVVFSGIRKNDGKKFRDLLPGEFTQMAGRAGRRGLDDFGTVIILAPGSEPPSIKDLKTMILGSVTMLQSQFRLTYNMILNLLRVETLRVEDMLKRSFSESSNQQLAPENERMIIVNEQELANLKALRGDNKSSEKVKTFYDLAVQYEKARNNFFEILVKSGYSIFKAGRVIVFKLRDGTRTAGIISGGLSLNRIKVFSFGKVEHKNSDFLPFTKNVKNFIKPFNNEGKFLPELITTSQIEFITNEVFEYEYSRGSSVTYHSMQAARNFLRKMLKNRDYFNGIWKEYKVSLKKTKKVELQESYNEWINLKTKVENYDVDDIDNLLILYKSFYEEDMLTSSIENLKKSISDENLELLPDYEQRIEVLKELGFIDEYSHVLLKGRVACEINSGNELLLTELILDNFFAQYETEEIAGLLSCFVFDQRNIKGRDKVTPNLDNGKKRINELAEKMRKIQEDRQIILSEVEQSWAADTVDRFGLMEVVYEWARGMSFEEITGLTEVLEGSIVRVITRLDEVFREVKSASRIIGDATLFAKMQECQDKIKRDIVFCASLYL